MSPKQLRDLGCHPKTQNILYANHYGWFERVRRGVYRLDGAGLAALGEYGEVVAAITRLRDTTIRDTVQDSEGEIS